MQDNNKTVSGHFSEAIEQRVAERREILYGKRYRNVTLSNFLAPEWAQIKIVNFLEKPANFMVYCGSPGIGKTHLCAALTHWAIETFGNNWRYWTENSLLTRLRESMENIKGDYLEVLKYMIDAEFLILDDVGSSVKVNEWRQEIFFAVVDYRYNTMKPTLITSNFSEKDFLQKYHARVHSRLFAKENTIIEILNGTDHRKENKYEF